MKKIKKIMFTCTLASLLMLSGSSLYGQTWRGSVSTDVTVAGNWVGGVPGSTDQAVFTDLGTSDLFNLPNNLSFHVGSIDYSNLTTSLFTLTSTGGTTALTIESGGISGSGGTLNAITTVNSGGGINIVNNGAAASGAVANTVSYNLFSGSGGINNLTLNGGGQTGLGLAEIRMALSTSVIDKNTLTTNAVPVTLYLVNSDSQFDIFTLGGLLTVGNNDPASATSMTIDGAIGGTGSINKVGGVDGTNGTISLVLTHDNTITGTLTITDGYVITLDGVGSTGQQITTFTSIVDNGILELGQTDDATLTMPITGTGNVFINGGETITLSNINNAYSGGTTVQEPGSTVSISSDANLGNVSGSLTLDSGTLLTTASLTMERNIDLGTEGPNTINTGTFTDTIAGSISGDGALIKTGAGTLILTSTTNSYIGGTTIAVNGGTLVGGSQNFPVAGPIAILGSGMTAGTLNFQQTTNGEFTGVLSGTGAITLASSTAAVTLTADSSGFTGVTTVPSGELSTNTGAKLGGIVNVIGGILSGTGTYGSINQSSGSVHPGHSPGIMLATNYTPTGGTFNVDIEGTGNVPGINNSELVVSDTATLSTNVGVVVTSIDGSFSLTGPYTILAAGTLVGKFNSTVTTLNHLTGLPLFIQPQLLYVGNDVLLDFQSAFFAATTNSNQRHVAEQLATITDPTTAESTLLTNLLSLPVGEMQLALDQLSGFQYAQMMNATEWSNDEFIRRLYDPLRPFLTTSPCCYSPCNCDDNFEFWVEGSALKSRIQNTNAAYGYKNSGYEVGFGVQFNQSACWAFGAAVTYEKGNLHYKIGGHGKTNTVLGALYGAYRDDDFYVLGDLVLGGSANKVSRSFSIDDVDYDGHGKPKAFQGALYVESGMNFMCEDFLVQPFLGFEGGYYNFYSFNETGTAPVALGFGHRSYGTVDSRLGVHLSSGQYNCGFSIGLDLAWQCRLSELQDHRKTFFEEFGTEFVVDGSHINRNSLEASINLNQRVNECWGFYLTGNGRFWNKAYAYDLVGGINVNW